MIADMTPTMAQTVLPTNHVISRDGTSISYLTTGHGQDVIVIPGALSVAADYDKFANALGQHWTVHTIERRGRGLSGPQGRDYGINKECEDVAALLAKTGARYVFGHSFGGLVALETARNNPALTKIAVYEPGVSINHSIPITWAAAYEAKLADKQYFDAFVEFVTGMNPGMFGKLPKPLVKMMLKMGLKEHEREHIFSLLDSSLREHKEVARLNNSYRNYAQISAGVLLTAGSKSPKLTHQTSAQLAEVIPASEIKVFDKLDHFGPDKRAPQTVADEVTRYFMA